MAKIEEERQAAKMAEMEQQIAAQAAKSGIDPATLGKAIDFIESYLEQNPFETKNKAAYWISLAAAAYNAGKVGGVQRMSTTLITPQEAVELSYEYGDITTIFTAKAIVEEWGNKYKDPVFNYYCMLSAVYTAGYIQAKREERKRTAQRKARAASRIKADRKEQLRQNIKMWADMTDSEIALTRMKDLVFSAWKHWGRKSSQYYTGE